MLTTLGHFPQCLRYWVDAPRFWGARYFGSLPKVHSANAAETAVRADNLNQHCELLGRDCNTHTSGIRM